MGWMDGWMNDGCKEEEEKQKMVRGGWKVICTVMCRRVSARVLSQPNN